MFGLKKIGILDPEGKNKNPLTGDNYTEEYYKHTHKWSNLPVYQDGNNERLIKVIKNNRVLILESGTGSGKTVLIPKYCLHALNYKGKVMVTVPKQVVAKSTAVRDAKWLDVTLGEEVGYKYRGSRLSEEDAEIKGDDKSESPNTKLLFATGGSLVSMLNRDPKLSEVDIVVIDEAHERSIDIDESLVYMRRALRLNKKLKLVVMSATLPNSDTFLDYFAEFNPAHEQFSGAPNKPVEVFYLPKGVKLRGADEIGAEALRILFEEIVEKDEPGDVLIFVNSGAQAVNLQGVVQGRYPHIFTAILVSGTSPEQEKLATEESDYKDYKKGRPQDGWSRRVVFATNVAESSITVKGLKFVIDSGTEIKSYYNSEKQQNLLKNQMITQAQADQRKGRVGRDAPGTCYRLYTKKDFDQMRDRPETTVVDADMTYNFLKYISSPEIKGSLLKMVWFVQELMEHPPVENVKMSLRNLVSLSLVKNISRGAKLTDEGRAVSEICIKGKLPDVNIGKAILAGRYYGCEKTVIIMAAIMMANSRGLKGISDFFFTKDRKFSKNILKEYQHHYGDLFSFYRLFIQFSKHSKRMDRKELERWAKDESVKISSLDRVQENAKTIYRSIVGILEGIEVLEVDDLPIFKNEDEAVMLSLLEGYFPNICKLEKGAKQPKYTNFYPPLKTTASFDSRGESYFSLMDKKKLPKYMFYLNNFSMDGRVTFIVCNEAPKHLIQLLAPEELACLHGSGF